uniref:Mediator of RNA polymerase II transcription subunit 16 isoform X2 n=1 Tax=Rhizophora mucronata TaxID=61149 RepID=A0A2P2KX81_RHIMU
MNCTESRGESAFTLITAYSVGRSGIMICMGIQNGGFALELGILAHVSDAQAIAFNFPHQATALKLRQRSGTLILCCKLERGCLSRIQNTVAGLTASAAAPAVRVADGSSSTMGLSGFSELSSSVLTVSGFTEPAATAASLTATTSADWSAESSSPSSLLAASDPNWCCGG